MPGVILLGRRFPFDGGRWRRATAIHLTLSVILSIGHIAAFGAAFFWVVGPTTLGPLRPRPSRCSSPATSRPTSSSTRPLSGVYFAFEYYALSAARARGGARPRARGATALSLVEARIHVLRMELNRTSCSTR
jgi:hypothetical protein